MNLYTLVGCDYVEGRDLKMLLCKCQCACPCRTSITDKGDLTVEFTVLAGDTVHFSEKFGLWTDTEI
jgi:hypothetical protein